MSNPSCVATLDDASGFSSPGCGTGPHQSSIGIEALAVVLANALGLQQAPENHRYQTIVQKSTQRDWVTGFSVPGSFWLMVWAYQHSLRRNGRRRGPINSLGSGQHFYRAHGPLPGSNRSISLPRRASRRAACNTPHAQACARAPSSRRRACAALSCARRSVWLAGSYASQSQRPR